MVPSPPGTAYHSTVNIRAPGLWSVHISVASQWWHAIFPGDGVEEGFLGRHSSSAMNGWAGSFPPLEKCDKSGFLFVLTSTLALWFETHPPTTHTLLPSSCQVSAPWLSRTLWEWMDWVWGFIWRRTQGPQPLKRSNVFKRQDKSECPY